MLILHHLAYTHPDRDPLFDNINLSIYDHQKIALVGNNGSGKSTLLKIMAGELQPSAGTVTADSTPYYIPQHFGQYNSLNVSQALRISDKLAALAAILAGDISDASLEMLDDDWGIEQRSRESLSAWGLDRLDLLQPVDSLSGGEKTRLFLAGISIHQPEIVLLDEPSNHLDAEGRRLLSDYIRSGRERIVLVSHDRSLLNLLPEICELGAHGIREYGGNYDFYVAQKAMEANALEHELQSREKELRKAKAVEREALERRQKLDARGRKKQEGAGTPTIALNTLRNKAEKSSARMKDVHAEKIGSISTEVARLRKELPDPDKMRLGFDDSSLHAGKVLATAAGLRFGHADKPLNEQPLDVRILSGHRIAVKGPNGSGKTTLIRTILGDVPPVSGTVTRAAFRTVCIDQDYSLIRDALTVYEQARSFNTGKLPEHEVKRKLTHFLFGKAQWDKPCDTLSGGEKMRLALCCLTVSPEPPDIIVLDEPTNNLDIQNTEILTAAVNEYRGTLLVVSHDPVFLGEIGITEEITLA